MNKTKDFVHTDNGSVLTSDSRDIAVPFTYRQQVFTWAGKNKIIIEYQGTLSGVDLWRIKDDDHRSWFALRWLEGNKL